MPEEINTKTKVHRWLAGIFFTHLYIHWMIDGVWGRRGFTINMGYWSNWERKEGRVKGSAEASSCLCPNLSLTWGQRFSGGSFYPEYTTPDSPLCSQPWLACLLCSISPAQQGCERSCWRRVLGCWAGSVHPARQGGIWGGFHPKTEPADCKIEKTISSLLLLHRLVKLSTCVHM